MEALGQSGLLQGSQDGAKVEFKKDVIIPFGLGDVSIVVNNFMLLIS